MTSALKRWLVLALFVGLTACQPPIIDIKVTQSGGRTMLGFYQDWGVFFWEGEVPCLKHVGLNEMGADRMARYAWLIEVDGDGQCADLAVVEIGVVPKGWHEVDYLKTVAGKTYFADVFGVGWGETRVTF